MSLAGMDSAVAQRFDRLCKVVGARGRGLSLAQLGDCHALARELEADTPDLDRVKEFTHRLDLDPEALP